jgi:hypothetical protein
MITYDGLRFKIIMVVHAIAYNEARSISQVCGLLLSEIVLAYKKEGPKFMQPLIAKQKPRAKDS